MAENKENRGWGQKNQLKKHISCKLGKLCQPTKFCTAFLHLLKFSLALYTKSWPNGSTFSNHHLSQLSPLPSLCYVVPKMCRQMAWRSKTKVWTQKKITCIWSWPFDIKRFMEYFSNIICSSQSILDDSLKSMTLLSLSTCSDLTKPPQDGGSL